MNFYLKAFLVTAVLTGIGYFVHNLIVENAVISIFDTYLFLGIATFLTVSALKFTARISPNNLGYVFLGLVFMKFGAILIFFPELIDNELELTLRQVLGFLAPYFLFLFAEIGIVLKWLNDS
ncbi:hypothetical protein BST97_10315 [Nonlabens spongiae]|uniref:Uncharacterized protein n=1 Tax=Nonlabens spongiae TaxID=331648 RepID=A0A1W6ML62_9FLAO|nr:hypothetical protein [Nonlabens spongiae]ARN78351.1 hypothetical protein BST97_10315 [Nonlabens spongiae]